MAASSQLVHAWDNPLLPNENYHLLHLFALNSLLPSSSNVYFADVAQL